MGTFFVYILKASVCLVPFYLFYRLLLSRETFHRFNRIALLGILLLSLLIPLVEVTLSERTEMHQTMLTWEQILLMASYTPEVAVVPIEVETITMSWMQMALLLYLVGIVCCAGRNVYSLMRLLRLIKSGRREKMEPGIYLIVHKKEIAPFSWMKYIVISEKDLEENGREILIHEKAHIRNRHSVDLMLAEVCIFFQWFNPATWLLKQELQNIHEYEADETVIREGVNAKQYQLLLIKKAVGTRLYSMANSFNHSSLKKRITMMLKEKSNPWARLKYLYVLPLAAIAVTAFARPEVSHKAAEISVVKVNDLAAIVETKVQETVRVVVKDTMKQTPPKEPIYEVVEQMPQFPGGIAKMNDYLAQYTAYPLTAKEAGVEGRVIVCFVIAKDGRIVAPKVVKSVNKELDKEAIRVISSMPKWNPGMQGGKAVAVKFIIPVVFHLGKVAISEKASASGKGLSVSFSNTLNQDHPLIIIDGKEAAYGVMEALKPDRIESISVLKDETATAVYGEKAKNGVVLIVLKKHSVHLDAGATHSDSLMFAVKGQSVVKVVGKVQNKEGIPLPGVSVLIKGTPSGTITNTD